MDFTKSQIVLLFQSGADISADQAASHIVGVPCWIWSRRALAYRVVFDNWIVSYMNSYSF
jgi:hypothetical protein